LEVSFNPKSVLITGGAGFIGSNLAMHIQENFPECEIVIFDKFNNFKKYSNGNYLSLGNFKNLNNFRGKIICGDISSTNDLSVLKNYKFDFIFHQAAISDTRVYDQELIMRTNINSFYFFIDKAVEDKSSLIYASSAATYGSLKAPNTIGNELPENPYGFSKLAMDKIAATYAKKFPNLRIIGLRFFNVYGRGEFFKGKTSSMIIQLGHQILRGENPRLFENSDSIYRDFVYINDVVSANIKCCSAKSGIYNVGSGIARSFKDVVDILQNELSTSLEIEYFQNPYLDYQNHTCADLSLSVDGFGYDPKYSLEAGIKDYLPYIIETL